mgnify:CR=1 FL=1
MASQEPKAAAPDATRTRIGIVGYGELGQYLTAYILSCDSLELAFIWNRHPEKLSAHREPRVRAAQLTGVQHYAYRAVQRMGQARSQLRRRAALRGYRRAATGLTELKRARDQLRGPAELLSLIPL